MRRTASVIDGFAVAAAGLLRGVRSTRDCSEPSRQSHPAGSGPLQHAASMKPRRCRLLPESRDNRGTHGALRFGRWHRTRAGIAGTTAIICHFFQA